MILCSIFTETENLSTYFSIVIPVGFLGMFCGIRKDLERTSSSRIEGTYVDIPTISVIVIVVNPDRSINLAQI